MAFFSFSLDSLDRDAINGKLHMAFILPFFRHITVPANDTDDCSTWYVTVFGTLHTSFLVRSWVNFLKCKAVRRRVTAFLNKSLPVATQPWGARIGEVLICQAFFFFTFSKSATKRPYYQNNPWNVTANKKEQQNGTRHFKRTMGIYREGIWMFFTSFDNAER